MPVDPLKALQLETDFLSGVEARFEAAKGRDFRGSMWESARFDESDRLRALLANFRQYDREKLKNLPSNRRVSLRGFEKRFWLWKKQTGVAIASVLAPLEHFASGSGGEPPPIGLGELNEHLSKLVGERRVPHIIGVCSPTGFTVEAREAKLSGDQVTVVLIEPDALGGWKVAGSGDRVDARLLRIFDPEGPKEKADRARRMVEGYSAELLTGGVSLSTVARRSNLPEEVVRQGFDLAAATDPELRVVKREGEVLLFRGAPVHGQERKGMSVIDRIKQLFSGDGDAHSQINLLSERRALLAQRRDRIYDDITKLETKEADLLEQGKAATSAVPRRRLAAQLAQMRKDIARQNTTAAMLNQQINVISTDIHNLTLVEQGKVAELPTSEELTEHAVQAEEMLETLKADAEMVGSLEMGMGESLASADELEILKEFEAADAEKAAKQALPQSSAPAKTPQPPVKQPESRSAYQPIAEPPSPPTKSRTKEGGAEAV